MTRLAAILLCLVACACPDNKPLQNPGSGSGSAAPVAGCEGARTKVEALYRAEAQVKEPKRVDEAVADNTTMVMNDCARAPDQVSACLAGATTIADIETKCLRQLDEEGSEGDELK